MTDVQDAVRKACDTIEPSEKQCDWPNCGCTGPISPAIGRFLSALIANARAEGAKEEREDGWSAIIKQKAKELIEAATEANGGKSIERRAVGSNLGRHEVLWPSWINMPTDTIERLQSALESSDAVRARATGADHQGGAPDGQ